MRHRWSSEPFDRAVSGVPELVTAMSYEAAGQWYSAAERFSAVANALSSASPADAARAFARAAACFELAGLPRDAACAYREAGRTLHQARIDCQSSGELLNRSGWHFSSVSEYSSAGYVYAEAARAFADCPDPSISSVDNIPPVPAGAGKFTTSALCFTAAADTFLKANDQGWAKFYYLGGGEAALASGPRLPRVSCVPQGSCKVHSS